MPGHQNDQLSRSVVSDPDIRQVTFLQGGGFHITQFQPVAKVVGYKDNDLNKKTGKGEKSYSGMRAELKLMKSSKEDANNPKYSSSRRHSDSNVSVSFTAILSQEQTWVISRCKRFVVIVAERRRPRWPWRD